MNGAHENGNKLWSTHEMRDLGHKYVRKDAAFGISNARTSLKGKLTRQGRSKRAEKSSKEAKASDQVSYNCPLRLQIDLLG